MTRLPIENTIVQLISFFLSSSMLTSNAPLILIDDFVRFFEGAPTFFDPKIALRTERNLTKTKQE